mgnify:CR=1 FL=1
MMPSPETNPFELAETVSERLAALAEELGLPHDTCASAVVNMIAVLVDAPNSVFETPPEYVRQVDAEEATVPGPVVATTHEFFAVLRARASRRDFAGVPLDKERLVSLMAWTFGVREKTVAYDFRDAPMRYIPSAGGLASTDGYVIVNNVEGMRPGSYYYDMYRGLVPLVEGHMSQKVSGLLHDSDWVSRSAAVVVCVLNTARVARKYGRMAAKLGLLDVGVALGHAELVANALELRSTLLGGLPSDEMARLLGVDDASMVPLGALAVGTRGVHQHAG